MKRGQRQIIVISGRQAACLQSALQLTKNLQTLHLDNPKKAQQYLGQEFDAVIFDTHGANGKTEFDPNAFGAISGTIRRGGYLLLLKANNWQTHSLFLKRFDLLLQQHKETVFMEAGVGNLSPLVPLAPYKTQSTEDQKSAVNAIIKVAIGHRRRPLIISADRGRGKSAALGIAVSQLYQVGLKTIILCAPARQAAAVVFEYAVFQGKKIPLQFYSPDELLQKKPLADLVLIDEAAAIPVPLLIQFAKRYSRIVFATTQHGYEGSGRGFTLSFKKALGEIAPHWRNCELLSPIRWDENDRLELFVFKALLLNAEMLDESLIAQVKLSQCQFEAIEKNSLLEDEPQLKELFGLLVSAHYQTKPSDFKQMLDDPKIRIFALTYQHHIISISLVVEEGKIDKTLAKQIFFGTRRIKGNLVAQALAANVGLLDAPTLKGQRMIRIAVHPVLQHQGFGSYLLKNIKLALKTDYFSTSFGATSPLLNFWKKSDFFAVYLSMKRDASSGTHSVIMLHAQSEKGKQMSLTAQQQFADAFPHLLADPFRDLETELVMNLLQKNNKYILSPMDKKMLTAFAKGQRGYENTFYPIWKLVRSRLPEMNKLNLQQTSIILLKVLQKHSWQRCSEKIGDEMIKGKKDALLILRKSILMILEKECL